MLTRHLKSKQKEVLTSRINPNTNTDVHNRHIEREAREKPYYLERNHTNIESGQNLTHFVASISGKVKTSSGALAHSNAALLPKTKDHLNQRSSA